MAKKGLSRLFFAKYQYDPVSGVKYTEGCETEKLASYSTELESNDDNDLYLNNGIAETEKGSFRSGTLTHTTGDLTNETSLLILGAKKHTPEIEGIEDDIEEIVYDDDIKPSELGVGLIELHQVDGEEFHRAIVLARVLYNLPNDSATTKGESVEWQTQEVSGKILRSEQNDATYKHPWKFSADFSTEDNAVKYIKYKLNITDPEKASLLVSSESKETN